MSLTDFRTLGRSGLVVSPLALGTMTFGTPRWGSPDDVSEAVFDAYVAVPPDAIAGILQVLPETAVVIIQKPMGSDLAAADAILRILRILRAAVNFQLRFAPALLALKHAIAQGLLGEARETTGRTITETDFIVHAGHSGDFFPHHMDAEFCKTLPFGLRIAHGTMVFTIGVGLTATIINPVAFSYGYDRLRLVRPVFIGDTIRSQIEITGVEPMDKRPGHGRVTERLTVTKQTAEVALVADHIYRVERRR